MTQDKIPQIDSIQELAEFWETHDLTDFSDELEEVQDSVFVRQMPVTVYFEPQESEVIQSLAKSNHTTESKLIHEWVVERIRTSKDSIE